MRITSVAGKLRPFCFAAALNIQDINAITITRIREGSEVLDGSAAPTGTTGSA